MGSTSLETFKYENFASRNTEQETTFIYIYIHLHIFTDLRSMKLQLFPTNEGVTTISDLIIGMC